MSAQGLDAIVIGGGANGLVAAARMAKAGRRVALFDAAPELGGQSRNVEFAPGYSAAPFALDPGWLPDAIASDLAIGRPAAAGDTPLSVVDGGGEALTLSRDAHRAAQAIARFSPDDAAKWVEFTRLLRSLSGFLEVLYQQPAPDVDIRGLGEALPLLSLGRKFRGLGANDMLEFLRTLPLSVGELVDDWFASVPLKAAIATAGVHEIRQGPKSGGTGFVLLHHLVGTSAGAIRGRVPWQEGPDAFTKAAEATARRLGVTIRLEAPVRRIAVHEEAVQGVVLASGEEIAAKTVISTADPAATFLELVDPVWLDPEFVHAIGNVRHRGSTAFVLYGLDALPAVAGLDRSALSGIISLTPDLVALERAADAAKYGGIAERPHVELTVPPAPSGKHVAIARVAYAPFRLRDGAWDHARKSALGDAATAAIESAAPGFAARILHRAVWSPVDLSERFGLYEGAATQGELALDQILFMRPVAGWGKHKTPVAGLYLGGCGTHPGPGILGGSGWLAAKRALGGA